MANVHVTYKEGNWNVKLGGAEDSKVFGTKEEAEKYGKQLAKDQKAELLIHNKDGKISERSSFGHDPRNIKG